MRRLLLPVVATLVAISAEGQSVRLSRGMVITKSTRIVKDTYRLPANESTDSAVIIVRGDNITVDFAGSTLLGTAMEADPDQTKGVAIRIERRLGRERTIWLFSPIPALFEQDSLRQSSA